MNAFAFYLTAENTDKRIPSVSSYTAVLYIFDEIKLIDSKVGR